MLAQQGMQDQTTEFFGVDWLNVRAIKISVDVGGEGDAQRIVGVDLYDASVLADELVELVGITDGDVFLAESLGQQRFDDTQALRDILCLPIRPGLRFVRPVNIKYRGIEGRQSREQHLFPGAVHVFAGFRSARCKNYLSST